MRLLSFWYHQVGPALLIWDTNVNTPSNPPTILHLGKFFNIKMCWTIYNRCGPPKWLHQSLIAYIPTYEINLRDQADCSSNHAPKGQSMIWRDVHQLHAMGELWRRYNFCEQFYLVIIGGNHLQQDIAFFDQLPDKMITSVDILGESMMSRFVVR